MAVVITSMQLCTEAAYSSNDGPQYESNPSRALNANVGPHIQVRPNPNSGIRGSPTSNMLQIRGYYVRSQFSPRGAGLEPKPSGLHPRWGMHTIGQEYSPHYGLVMAKQPRIVQVQAKKWFNWGNVMKPKIHPGPMLENMERAQLPQSEEHEEEGESKINPIFRYREQFRAGFNTEQILDAKLLPRLVDARSFRGYVKIVFSLTKRYVLKMVADFSAQSKLNTNQQRSTELNAPPLQFAYEIGVVVKIAKEAWLKISEDVEWDVPMFKKGTKPETVKEEKVLLPHGPVPEPMKELPAVHVRRVLNLRDLAAGTRVIFRDNHEYRYGIWDGDAVIRGVMARACTCADCTAAAEFNREYAAKFEAGDHLYAECERNKQTQEPMFHQGIYDGTRYVYHFADSSPNSDAAYELCEECRARGLQHRAHLKSLALGPSGVRKSCLYCFAEKPSIDEARADADYIDHVRKKISINPIVKKALVVGSVSEAIIDHIDQNVAPGHYIAQKPYIEAIPYGSGYQAWKDNTDVPLSPIMCMKASREGTDIVKVAREFYETDSFGRYSKAKDGVSHNCESFAYFCKTGIYASHQVTEGLIKGLLLSGGSLVESDIVFMLGMKAFLFVDGNHKISVARKKAKQALAKVLELPAKVPEPEELVMYELVTG